MKKLKLDPESLRVESFRPTPETDPGRGTVEANGYTEPGYPSCNVTCGASPPPPSEDFCGAFRPTVKACCV